MTDEHGRAYAWLLHPREACPRCGADRTRADRVCRACELPLWLRLRPPRRSNGILTLAGMWGILAAGMLLLAGGMWMRAAGLLPADDTPAESPVWRALARAIALAGIELPQASTPPPLPLWLVPILIVLAGGAGIMAYGTFVRATWVFYAACSVAVLLIVAAVAVSLLIGGPIVLMVSFALLIMAILIGLGYIVVADDLFGEDQLVVYAPRGIHGRDLFIEGQAHAAAGRFFVAAQCWARAVAREPGNAEYLHALGLTLARLGQHAAALAALQRAHAAAPGRSDIITSIETVTKETIHGWK